MKCGVLIADELIKSTLIIMLIYQHTHQYTCNVFAERLTTQTKLWNSLKFCYIIFQLIITKTINTTTSSKYLPVILLFALYIHFVTILIKRGGEMSKQKVVT